MSVALDTFRSHGVVCYAHTEVDAVIRMYMEDFVLSILHGPDEHKEWLVEAGECCLLDKPVPERRG